MSHGRRDGFLQLKADVGHEKLVWRWRQGAPVDHAAISAIR